MSVIIIKLFKFSSFKLNAENTYKVLIICKQTVVLQIIVLWRSGTSVYDTVQQGLAQHD